MKRPYTEITSALRRSIPSNASRKERMNALVGAVWKYLEPLGVSWVGFYLPAPGGEELILGPRRDKPACSPIGFHGVCGHSWRERRPVVVEDIRDLGQNYIACDPADRSELVLPVFGSDGEPWAVLDLDSHEPDFFTQADVTGLRQVLETVFPAA